MDIYLLKYNLSSGLWLITAHWMVSGVGSEQTLLEQDDCIVRFAVCVYYVVLACLCQGP